MYCKFILLFFFSHANSLSYLNEIEYYEELIKENIQNTRSFEAPTYYRDFELNDEESVPNEFGTYDFIIIGGGTAGTLLSSRLSEIQNWKVLVIEAGGYENDFTDIPSSIDYTWSTDFNWGFSSTPQETGCPVSPQLNFTFPRGKGLGGSSILHDNIFSRGSKADFERWSNIGLSSWSYDQVLPYFKKHEDATSLNNIDIESHGFGGPLTIENYKNTSDLSIEFIEIMNSLGYNTVDYNSRNPIGVSYIQKSTRNGRRCSGYKAFLAPNVNRTNLKLQTLSLVTRILVERNIATGVEFRFNNTKYVARANLEVILSAGSFQSPQILMLSGIGPRYELSQLNISTLLDLPVGQNLQDHYQIRLTSSTNFTIPITARAAITEYLKTFGPLTTSFGIEALSFHNTSSSIGEYMTVVTNSISLVNDSLEFDAAASATFSVLAVLLHPQSIGTIRLASRDPLQFPLIDTNYLAEETDVETLVESAELLAEILKSARFAKYNVSIVADSNCSDFTFETKDYWRCVVRCSGGTTFHPFGSCKMGLNAASSVVNERLLVHGMKNLRVVDASVIPVTLTGHMFATVFMIAEKASDIIKEDYS